MLTVSVSYGDHVRSVVVQENTLLDDTIIAAGRPLEQPSAGRGTCLKSKPMAEGHLSPLDEKELEGLTTAEQAADYRLACRSRVQGDASVILAPTVVHSNKTFRACDDDRREDVALGSSAVAAFPTTLDERCVCAGAASLNLQTVFGADVISRLAAARRCEQNSQRLSALALASVGQARDALRLQRRCAHASAWRQSWATAPCTISSCDTLSTPSRCCPSLLC